MQSSWHSGACEILTYEIEEILGAKLRDLYQRKKGRDLYDMAMAYLHFKKLDDKKMVDCFLKYMNHGVHSASRAEFEGNLRRKLTDRAFIEDIQPLLKPDVPTFNVVDEGDRVKSRTLSLLPGDPWKGESKSKK